MSGSRAFETGRSGQAKKAKPSRRPTGRPSIEGRVVKLKLSDADLAIAAYLQRRLSLGTRSDVFRSLLRRPDLLQHLSKPVNADDGEALRQQLAEVGRVLDRHRTDVLVAARNINTIRRAVFEAVGGPDAQHLSGQLDDVEEQLTQLLVASSTYDEYLRGLM